jgi:hypothetical protein
MFIEEMPLRHEDTKEHEGQMTDLFALFALISLCDSAVMDF